MKNKKPLHWQVVAWILMAGSVCLSVGFSIADASEARGKGGTRSKVIDFEGDLIEGVNKRPLDSLNQLSEGGNKDDKAHLYRKRRSFRSESRETLREIGSAR